MEIQKLFEKLQREWAKPRVAMHSGRVCPFKLQCDLPVRQSGFGEINGLLPKEYAEFLLLGGSPSKLFFDPVYGQWGLEIFEQEGERRQTDWFEKKRTSEFKSGDKIVGRFLGDAELLLLRCDSNATDYGSVLIALPLDSRTSWPLAATNFGIFLNRFSVSQGAKFWENDEER